ncbi:hypothetical protein ACFLQL_02270 [Verrucomicrobiota bacterium]
MTMEVFNPSDVFTGAQAVNVLKSADEVRANNLKKVKRIKIGVSTLNKLKPEEVPTDEQIMRDEDRQLQATKDEAVEVKEIKTQDTAGTMNKNILKCIANRTKITFGMDSGDISIPAVDVIESDYGIMVLIPAGLNDTVFTPKPGANVTVKAKGKIWKCFSPGTIFNLQFLDLIAVVLILESKEEPHHEKYEDN